MARPYIDPRLQPLQELDTPYQHETFVNPIEGVPEAFAQGVFEAPGELAALIDLLTRGEAHYGQTLQEQVDDFTGVDDLGYNPADYGASPALQSMVRLGGNVIGDPLNLGPITAVAGKGLNQFARHGLNDMLSSRPITNEIGALKLDGGLSLSDDMPMDDYLKNLPFDDVDEDLLYEIAISDFYEPMNRGGDKQKLMDAIISHIDPDNIPEDGTEIVRKGITDYYKNVKPDLIPNPNPLDKARISGSQFRPAGVNEADELMEMQRRFKAKKDSANLLDSRLLPIPAGLLGLGAMEDEYY